MVQHLDVHVHTGVAAQRRGQRRNLGGPVARVGHDDHVGLTRAGPRHLEPEPGEVVAGGSDGHEFDAAAARSESKRPQRVTAPPVDQLIELADHDIHTVGAQLLDVFIVIERIVFHRFDVDSLYFPSKAPFFHA